MDNAVPAAVIEAADAWNLMGSCPFDDVPMSDSGFDCAPPFNPEWGIIDFTVDSFSSRIMSIA